jgi:Ca2+-transporting ATPase
LEMFTTVVAVAVAAIPEGLPVAMTVILALGMQRILKKKGLVRKLVAAETLGSTSVIATDKTATLTEGKIKVTKVLVRKNKDLIPKIAVLCNEAFVENLEAEGAKWKLRGRPTDKALLSYGLEQGFRKEKLEKELPKVNEIPFDNQKKLLATLHKFKKGNILFVAGAPERILEMSKLGDKERKKWLKILENIASQGFRTIALATKITEKTEIDEEVFQNLELAALLGLTDPLRKEVKGAIKTCRQAGMKPILVTGDHKLTAKTIAAEIGLKTNEENLIEGKDLDKLSDEEFEKRVKKIEVYARSEPRHKLRIIEAWQEKGEVVAMTGDGINDAPALKKADIGVALGSGTDIAKEVSDLILLPDSFNIIVAAVEEGRAILDNIRKIITYLFCSAFTEVILVGISIFAGWPLPILAAQILWINLIEDGPLSLALAFEPKEKDLMKQKPAGHDIPLLTGEMKALIFVIGIITDLLLIGLFFWLFKFSGYEISYIRSIIFAGLAIDSIFYIFACKSLRRNIWQINLFSNRFLILAWVFAIMVLLAGLYLPTLQNLLKTMPLNLFDWQLVLGLGFLNIILIETTKHYFIVRHQTEI